MAAVSLVVGGVNGVKGEVNDVTGREDGVGAKRSEFTGKERGSVRRNEVIELGVKKGFGSGTEIWLAWYQNESKLLLAIKLEQRRDISVVRSMSQMQGSSCGRL